MNISDASALYFLSVCAWFCARFCARFWCLTVEKSMEWVYICARARPSTFAATLVCVNIKNYIEIIPLSLLSRA